MTTGAAQLAIWWRNTRGMPWLLRQLCQGGMVAGPILMLFALLPIADWTVNGRRMPYGEFWSSGAGASVALFVLLITFGCWGLAARVPSSRWALVVAPFAPYPPLVLSGSSFIGDPSAGDLLTGCLTAAVIYVCLFHLSSVRRYLEGGNAGHKTLSV